MSIVIDKRGLPKNNAVGSRQKFIDKYKEIIKQRVKETILKGKMDDALKGDKKIKIKSDDLGEPSFELDSSTGKSNRILIGNKEFLKGQKLRRPAQGNGGGKQGSKDGGGEDDFEFVLTEKEFLDLFFEELALPDFVKREITGTAYEIQHAGYSRSGGPTSLNIRRTMLNAIGRKAAIAAQRGLCEHCEKPVVIKNYDVVQVKNPKTDRYVKIDRTAGRIIGQKQTRGPYKNVPVARKENESTITTCPSTIDADKTKLCVQCGKLPTNLIKKHLQYIEDLDLRYNHREKVDVPTTKAVMFALMDVSGSMGEFEKDIAKRFYLLLNLFLKRNYTTVQIVYIRHAETALVVDEDTFFHSRESGGTVISSGYELINDQINKNFNPDEWNIYVAQASDGDNWPSDNEYMEDLIVGKILPKAQYLAYIDITGGRYATQPGESESDVMKIMTRLMNVHKNLQARSISALDQIWTVFSSLFKKKEI